MPQDTRDDLLGMLKRADTVAHLVLDSCGSIPFSQWAPCLPACLQHLNCRGSQPVLEASPSSAPLPTRPAVKLQGLSSLVSRRDSQHNALFGPHSATEDFLDCTSLQHLKLGMIPSAFVTTNHIRSLSPFSTLNLKILEIGVLSLDLYSSLEWLSKSLTSAPSEGKEGGEDRLNIVLLLCGCDATTERGRPDLWRTVIARVYSNLLMFNVLVFGVEAEHCHAIRTPVGGYAAPAFLAPLTSTQDLLEPILYSSLWKSCLCSGWWT